MAARSGRFALVLGAGGTVGMAYHAGVLRALEEATGLDPREADLIIGTSAGSVMASYLRGGWSTEDLMALACGIHPHTGPITEDDRAEQRRTMFAPAFRSPGHAMRRGAGSAWVVARSLFGPMVPTVPGALARTFPAGMFRMDAARERFEAEIGLEWPSRPTWLIAHDLRSGRRMVLGSDAAPTVDLPTAVLASCAIPGVYRPVRAGGMTLVDGGVRSTTHLDLAAVSGHRRIIGIAPMAFDPALAPDPVAQLSRRRAARALSREAALARRRGAEVTLFRPCRSQLRIHGPNLMDPDAGEEIARAAYHAALGQLAQPRFSSLRAA